MNLRSFFEICAIVLIVSFWTVGLERADAASSRVYFYEATLVTETNQWDETFEYIDEQYVGVVEHGGAIALDLTKSYVAYVESDALSFEYAPKGELYYVPDTGLEDRNHVAIMGGFEVEMFTLASGGTYEADVYGFYNPAPQPVQGPFEKFFAQLVGIKSVYAQVPEENPDIFVETVQFSIIDPNAVAECCSNVLFIPGIKGSVLKKDNLIGSDTLWPPTIWSDDVSQLALTETGESVHEIFVDGVLEDFSVGPFSTAVYSPFIVFMNGVVAEDTINEWKSLPYDWRFSPEKILEDGIQTETGVVDVIAEIESLAESSDTKQITIVAHSMGGLVGKAIIKELEAQGKEDLIDSFVMVGSPQLGTPQAILSILHGNGEGIPNNLEGYYTVLHDSVAEPATVRKIAQNMASAYNLLPSAAYFSVVTDPVISFDENAVYTESWRNEWGNTISNYADFATFLTGQGVSRSNPAEDDLKTPEVLGDSFLTDAKTMHSSYDTYAFPDHIRVVEIAGWGRPTAKGVRYTTEHGEPSYNPVFTREGDKTVVYSSAVSAVGEKYFTDLDSYRNQDEKQVEHKDLLSVIPVQELLRFIIEEESVEGIDFISSSKFEVEDTADQLLVSSHSPVALGAYDEYGNFTGINTDTDELSEEIPGSTLFVFGTDQYIFLPKEGMYTFVYKGTGRGSTTVAISAFEGDEVASIARYTDIPTTENTSATFEVDASVPEDTTIELDQDNDGTPDEEVLPDGTEPIELSLEELFMLLRADIEALNLKRYLERSFLVKVKLLERSTEARFPFLRKILGQVQIRGLEYDVRLLERKGQITSAQAQNLQEILAKIKEKI